MNPARFLDESRVDLALDAVFGQDEDGPSLEALANHMVDLLATSEDVVNPTKLRNDLINRERRAPSLLGRGVAMPHVRTMQARKLVMAVGVAHDGLVLEGTPDGEPVRLVIAIVGPPYDDRAYLQVYKRLGERLLDDAWVARLVAAEHPGEVLRALGSH